jgi:hypothetical protein
MVGSGAMVGVAAGAQAASTNEAINKIAIKGISFFINFSLHQSGLVGLAYFWRANRAMI